MTVDTNVESHTATPERIKEVLSSLDLSALVWEVQGEEEIFDTIRRKYYSASQDMPIFINGDRVRLVAQQKHVFRKGRKEEIVNTFSIFVGNKKLLDGYAALMCGQKQDLIGASIKRYEEKDYKLPAGSGIIFYKRLLNFIAAMPKHKPTVHRVSREPYDLDNEKWNQRFVPVLRQYGYKLRGTKESGSAKWEKLFPATE